MTREWRWEHSQQEKQKSNSPFAVKHVMWHEDFIHIKTCTTTKRVKLEQWQHDLSVVFLML